MSGTRPHHRAKAKQSRMGPWPRLQKFWDVRAACNFIGGGTGSGLLMVAAFYSLLGHPIRFPVLIGMLSISFGLLMVFLEIGKPWRSPRIFFHPQTSWMTREGIVAVPLFALSGLAFLFAEHAVGGVAVVLAGLFAGLFLYCQTRILHAARSVPAWRHAALKPYMMVSGMTEGAGIALCLPALMFMQSLWAVLVLLIVLRLWAWLRYAGQLRRDGAPEAACKEIERRRTAILLGHLLPIGLVMTAWVSDIGILAASAGLTAASIGWYTKIIIVTRAAQTRGFAIPHTPVRGRRAGGVLGSDAGGGRSHA